MRITRKHETGLTHEQETYLLRRGLFEVQNEVGLGMHEEAYHQAYRIWLQSQGVRVLSKPPHRLHLRGEVACTLTPDFVVWDAITVELKALHRRLHDEEKVQLFDYLKCRGDHLGLLVNVGLDRVYVDRLAYTPSTPDLKEEWGQWTGRIPGSEREIGVRVH